METMEAVIEQPVVESGGELEQSQDTQQTTQDQQRQADK